MNKELSSGSILELLNINYDSFEWARQQLGIVGKKNELINYYWYSIQDLIDIYNFVYNRNRVIILDSKINFKEMKL